MKLKDILENYEFMSKDDTIATKVGQQLFTAASQEAYKSRRPGDKDHVKKIADALANRFHSNILKSIDSELNFLKSGAD